ncbi:hypothetical protein [Spiroplasma endosymbiont of Dioctria linearis]
MLRKSDAIQNLLIYDAGYRRYINWIKRGKLEYKRKYHIHAKEVLESI